MSKYYSPAHDCAGAIVRQEPRDALSASLPGGTSAPPAVHRIRCRTAALGGRRDPCTGRGHATAVSYNFCRNRHCSTCQSNARLPGFRRVKESCCPRVVHVVFTLPRELAPLALQNKRLTSTWYFTPAPQRCSKWIVIPSTWNRDRLLQRTPYLGSATAKSLLLTPARLGCPI